MVLEDPALAGSTEIGDNSLLEGFALMRDLIPQVQASGMPVDDLVDAIADPAERGDRTTLGEDLCADALRAIAEGLLALDVTVLDVVLDGTLVPPFDADRSRSRCPGSCWRPIPPRPTPWRGRRILEILARTSPQLATWAGAGSDPPDPQLDRRLERSSPPPSAASSPGSPSAADGRPPVSGDGDFSPLG